MSDQNGAYGAAGCESNDGAVTGREQVPEFTREQVRKALAEADSSGYQRGRNEALMEAIGLAERRGAKATAKHLQQRYESYQEACRER